MAPVWRDRCGRLLLHSIHAAGRTHPASIRSRRRVIVHHRTAATMRTHGAASIMQIRERMVVAALRSDGRCRNARCILTARAMDHHALFCGGGGMGLCVRGRNPTGAVIHPIRCSPATACHHANRVEVGRTTTISPEEPMETNAQYSQRRMERQAGRTVRRVPFAACGSRTATIGMATAGGIVAGASVDRRADTTCDTGPVDDQGASVVRRAGWRRCDARTAPPGAGDGADRRAHGRIVGSGGDAPMDVIAAGRSNERAAGSPGARHAERSRGGFCRCRLLICVRRARVCAIPGAIDDRACLDVTSGRHRRRLTAII